MAVTIPTSTENLKEIGINNSLEDQVKKLVMLSHECGVHGVISSGQNIKMIRSLVGSDFYIITPGIRSDDQKGKDDQKKTISYIFKEKGEKYFRELEEKLILDIPYQQNLIISLGGGSIISSLVRKKLKKEFITVYLDVNLDIIVDRLKKSNIFIRT